MLRRGHLRALGAAGVLALAAAGAAGAHHAITLNYDPDSSGTIEGVVDEVFWANPHVHYYLTVTDAEGATRLWDMETGNLNVMRSRGLTRDSIKVGDRLTVTGTLGRDGAAAILANTVEKDGAVIWGRQPPGTAGAPAATPVAQNYGEDERAARD
jgi:thiamine monophosphate kinase